MGNAYSIRLKDLVPLSGLRRHARRCGKYEASNPEISETLSYNLKANTIGVLLATYNASFIIGTAIGIVKGLELLLK